MADQKDDPRITYAKGIVSEMLRNGNQPDSIGIANGDGTDTAVTVLPNGKLTFEIRESHPHPHPQPTNPMPTPQPSPTAPVIRPSSNGNMSSFTDINLASVKPHLDNLSKKLLPSETLQPLPPDFRSDTGKHL